MITDDSYAQHLGIRLTSDEPIAVSMQIGPQHQNFLGVTHGGAVFSLADCAFALASNAPGERAVAIDTHLALTGGASEGDLITAIVEGSTRGRSLATYRITVTRSDGRTIGLFTGTVQILH